MDQTSASWNLLTSWLRSVNEVLYAERRNAVWNVRGFPARLARRKP